MGSKKKIYKKHNELNFLHLGFTHLIVIQARFKEKAQFFDLPFPVEFYISPSVEHSMRINILLELSVYIIQLLFVV